MAALTDIDLETTRAGFLAGAAALLAVPAVAAESTVIIPTAFDGGRFFAIPRVASDGAVMRLWLDTDGGGFVFAEAVERWKLPVLPGPGGRKGHWTRLPAFDPSVSVPPPRGRDGLLPIFTRDEADRRDAILAGFDGQLGASWFQERVWMFDYVRRRVLLRSALAGTDGVKIPVRFRTDAAGARRDGAQSPRLDIAIGGGALAASLDIAATVALTETARTLVESGPRAVRATSFVRRKTFAAWQRAHPQWHVLRDVSPNAGIDAIRVPAVQLGPIDLGTAWFTTRPGDDVFEGDDDIDAKLGAPAFYGRTVSLDYPAGVLALRSGVS